MSGCLSAATITNLNWYASSQTGLGDNSASFRSTSTTTDSAPFSGTMTNRIYGNNNNNNKRPQLIGQIAHALRNKNMGNEKINYSKKIYNGTVPDDKLRGDCSCRNPTSMKECCQRILFRRHKMGHVLTNTLLIDYEPQIQLDPRRELNNDPQQHLTPFYPTNKDYRIVILWRDMYSSLVSGYLYHKTGYECWLDHMGKPVDRPMHWMDWDEYITTYEINPPKRERSLCQYLADVDDVTGMRVYIEWIFHRAYVGSMERYAISQTIQQVRDRVLVIKYEDLANPVSQYNMTNHGILDFLYNGTIHAEWKQPDEEDEDKVVEANKDDDTFDHQQTSVQSSSLRRSLNAEHRQQDSEQDDEQGQYSGGHSTSHDPMLRNHLKSIIYDLDNIYYNNEIEWVNNVMIAASLSVFSS